MAPVLPPDPERFSKAKTLKGFSLATFQGRNTASSSGEGLEVEKMRDITWHLMGKASINGDFVAHWFFLMEKPSVNGDSIWKSTYKWWFGMVNSGWGWSVMMSAEWWVEFAQVSSNQAAGCHPPTNQWMFLQRAIWCHRRDPKSQAHQQMSFKVPVDWWLSTGCFYQICLGPITILYGNPHSYPLYNQAAAWKDMEWQRVLNMAQLVSLCNVKLREVAI